MCCHRLYIFTTCGHTTLSPTPLLQCPHASVPPNRTRSATCTPSAHPYQSWKIPSLCPPCDARRTELLNAIDSSQALRFEAWRWKVSYGMPAHGKDFWGKKAEERQRGEISGGGREGSEAGGSAKSAGLRWRRPSLRWSWRRNGKGKSP